jgi:hypothetical protein
MRNVDVLAREIFADRKSVAPTARDASVSLARLTCVCLEDAPAINAFVLEFVLEQVPESARKLANTSATHYKPAKTLRAEKDYRGQQRRHRRSANRRKVKSRCILCP